MSFLAALGLGTLLALSGANALVASEVIKVAIRSRSPMQTFRTVMGRAPTTSSSVEK